MKAHDMHDGELLKEYVDRDSQVAFATLVERYMNLVYSVALREVRNADLAHDVTQVVFLLLAKKASSLRVEQTIAGWLYKTVRFASKDALKQERRRLHREQKAGEEIMHLAQFEDRELTWAEIEPTLYTALDSLGQEDREAVLLRFFQKNSLKEVGANLGISEDAARMKVSRAVDKLRRHFKRHGFTLSGATLASLLSANAVQAAPSSCLAAAVGLGSSFAGGAALSGVAGSTALTGAQSVAVKGAVQTFFEGVTRAIFMSQVKVATAVVVGSAVLGTGVTKVVKQAQNRTPQSSKPLAQAPRRAALAPRPTVKPLRNLRPVTKAPLLVQVAPLQAQPLKAQPLKTQPLQAPRKAARPQRAVITSSVKVPAPIVKTAMQAAPSKAMPKAMPKAVPKAAALRPIESMVPEAEAPLTPVTKVDLPLPAVSSEASPKVEAPAAPLQTVLFDGQAVPIPQFSVPEAPKVAAQPEEPKAAVAEVKVAEVTPEAARKPDAKKPPHKIGQSLILGLLSQLSRAPIFNRPRTGFSPPENRSRGFGPPPNFGRERDRDR